MDSIVLGALAYWTNDLDEGGDAPDREWGDALNERLNTADQAFRLVLGKVVQEIETKAGPFIALKNGLTGASGIGIALTREVSDSLDRAMDGAVVLVDEARERLRNKCLRMAFERLNVVPIVAPFAPWRRLPAAPTPADPGYRRGVASLPRFTWRAWLLVAILFLLLSSIHTGAGYQSFNALVDSYDSLKQRQGHAGSKGEIAGNQPVHVPHQPFEERWGLVSIVLLSAISYCATLYAIVRSRRHALPAKDRRLARRMGLAISAVLLLLLLASCILLTHGQDFDRILLARCIGHVGPGVGLLLAFHLAEEMVMRFLGRYLRSKLT